VSRSRRSSTLTGTLHLVRLDLRLDRVRMPVWAVVVLGLVLVSAGSVMNLYSTPEEIAGYVSLINISGNMSAVNSALNGPGFGFEDPDVGVVLVNEVAIWGSLAFAFMGIFQMARHTRAEEEAERTEVLRSRMVGRHAGLAAAAITVGGLEVLVGLATFAGLVGFGYAAVGSAALVSAYVAAGMLFAALTAVAAQVASTARATTGLGVGALGVAFLVRAVGDMGDGSLSWLSPIGWVHRVRPFAGEDWWVLGLSVAVILVAAVVAVVLSDRRNLGSGLLPQRLGPHHAGPATSHPLGLTARLQKGPLLGWSVGLFVLGAAYGSIGSDIEQMFTDNPDLERFIPMGAGSVTDAYLSYTLALGAMMTAGYVISSVLRMRTEESSGRLELMLAHPLSRSAWVGDHLLVAVSGALVVLAASGLGTGVGIAFALGEPDQVVRMVVASVALMPVELATAGLAMTCVGLVPKVAPLAWVGLVVLVVVGLFADLFSLPDWVRWVSPLEHLPRMPADGFDPVAFVAVTAVGVVLIVVGVAAFRRRDVPAL
jgi:ABC-2 type transport system permease protein